MGIFVRKQKKTEKKLQEEQQLQTLSDVIRGMQYCVNTAAEITEQHYLSQLSDYFDEDGNPVMFTYRNSTGQIVEIPVFTLMNHAELLLNEINIKMSLPMKYSEVKTEEVSSNAVEDFKVSRSVFYLDNLATTPKGRQGEIEIEMRFKSGERPEAVSRIVDKLMNIGVQYTPEEKWEQERSGDNEAKG